MNHALVLVQVITCALLGALYRLLYAHLRLVARRLHTFIELTLVSGILHVLGLLFRCCVVVIWRLARLGTNELIALNTTRHVSTEEAE